MYTFYTNLLGIGIPVSTGRLEEEKITSNVFFESKYNLKTSN